MVGAVFKVLLAVKILVEVEAKDSDESLHNRALVVIREARERGIQIKAIKNIFGQSTNHFTIQSNGVKKIFECFPHLTLDSVLPVAFDDKGDFKELLRKEGLPYAQGSVFQDYAPAIDYVRNTIGFPVVVKPRSGSLSKHTTCDIKNESELREAVTIVKIISNDFIVEEFIAGEVHRITLVAGKVVASCLREPPNVIGDGVQSIEELIELKNQDPRRGPINKRNYTLHKIPITGKTTSILASQNLTLSSISASGRKVYLHDKVILACGADIHDTTDKVHPDNISLFEKIGALCAAPVIGIDFITPDISQPYYEQRSAVLEVNSLPYIDMHHYPVTGQARNVAGSILDYWISCQSV